MNALEELMPVVDIDAALATFRNVCKMRRRRRRAVGGSAAAALVAVAIVTASLGNNTNTSHHVAITGEGQSTTTRASTQSSSPTPQIAIASYLEANPKVRERARFRFDASTWIVIAEGVPIQDAGSTWTVGAIQFSRNDHGWEDIGSGGTGLLDRCFSNLSVTGLVKPSSRVIPPGFAWAVAADPRWLIQEFVEGKWTYVPTTRGVYFTAHPNATWRDANPVPAFRPVMPDGRVPACYANR